MVTHIEIVFISLSALWLLWAVLPFSPIQHWTVRIFDYLRLQLAGIAAISFIAGLIVLPSGTWPWGISALLTFIALIIHMSHIVRYLPFRGRNNAAAGPSGIHLLCMNVLQTNERYDDFLRMVGKEKPDLLLTLESGTQWDRALQPLREEFGFCLPLPLDNTYGMHFFSRLKVLDCQIHYPLTKERPAIEVRLLDRQGREFIFWGLHPPPPSPTEEPTAEKKNAELLTAARRIREADVPVVVSGDFNNVCWSHIARLFARTGGLQDARIGRGLYSSFPVRPFFMRYPIDLLYHSRHIDIHSMGTLNDIGSDHLPLYARFSLNGRRRASPTRLDKEDRHEIQEIISNGRQQVDNDN